MNNNDYARKYVLEHRGKNTSEATLFTAEELLEFGHRFAENAIMARRKTEQRLEFYEKFLKEGVSLLLSLDQDLKDLIPEMN